MMHKQENNIKKYFFIIFVLLIILIRLLLTNLRVKNKIIPIKNKIANSTTRIFVIMTGSLSTGRKKQDINSKNEIPEVRIDTFFIFFSKLFSIFIYIFVDNKKPSASEALRLLPTFLLIT
ncbi:hypothetical protein KJ980_08280 [Patescibacteria group bacterium]|nr:hypothetical protein [Patescibacteria group bacterium]MBU4017377.1 hypothetical protein [Patescibacteria group bacterium]MBU4099612.1 hypothetical protein [Patescibacteria group bacterium]